MDPTQPVTSTFTTTVQQEQSCYTELRSTANHCACTIAWSRRSSSFDRPVRTGDVLKFQVVPSPVRLAPGRSKTGTWEQGQKRKDYDNSGRTFLFPCVSTNFRQFVHKCLRVLFCSQCKRQITSSCYHCHRQLQKRLGQFSGNIYCVCDIDWHETRQSFLVTSLTSVWEVLDMTCCKRML